jgi:hypothetical protein
MVVEYHEALSKILHLQFSKPHVILSIHLILPQLKLQFNSDLIIIGREAMDSYLILSQLQYTLFGD